MYELIYTSAREGMIPMRSGFTSVAWTEGFPANLVPILENMSSYTVLFNPGTPDESKNPEAFSYRKLQFGGTLYRIVGRTAFAGLDYTNRTNKIAHHLVFAAGQDELESAGGALAVAFEKSNFTEKWTQEAHALPVKRAPMCAEMPKTAASPTWKKYTSDAGFAGVLAELFMQCPGGSGGAAYIVSSPGLQPPICLKCSRKSLSHPRDKLTILPFPHISTLTRRALNASSAQ